MIFPLWLLNIFGWVASHWRIVGISVLALAIALTGFCVFKHVTRPKLDEKTIQRAENAIKEHNDVELKEILAEADAKEEVIAGNVANAEKATEQVKADAKKKYDAMTVDELAAELEKRK